MSSKPAPIVSVAELAALLGQPDVAVVDCRFDLSHPSAGRQAHARSHIPGAVYAHLDENLSSAPSASTGRHPLPDPVRLAATLGAWGIDRSTRVIAYDAGNGAIAARLWWLLRWLGSDAGAVLDGGFAAWEQARLPVSTAVTAVAPRTFIPAPRPELAVDANAVAMLVRSPDARVFDVRAAERFTGTVEPLDPVAGHVPGARNLPFTALLGPEGCFLPRDKLRERLQEALAGIPAERTIAMCGSGVTACHLLVALEAAGLPGARLYPGSWSEWIRNPGRPVATGPGSAVSSGEKIVNTTVNNHAGWKIEDALDIYQIPAWGKGYFHVNAAGHLVVRPDLDPRHEIDLLEVVKGLQARDLATPVVIRFSDILKHRLARLHEAFALAIAENDYRNRYCAVYPIKVNQQRLVVEEVYRYGAEFNFGLEAGSKPELLAVMALTEDAPDRMIVCNGFKDDSYIEAVILATKLGRTIIPVIENFTELALVLRHAGRYGVRPRIGVRVKLASEGAGRWRGSAGEKSKFGLFVSEILELVAVLKQHDMLDCLELVHCHPGSQLHDIRRIKDAINELAHVYAELKRMGAGLKYIDVGGGLGVDYDGSGTNFPSSMNYTVGEYASDVVYRIASVCNARGIDHPVIVSESGRAIAAHHSVLVFNALGSSSFDQFRITDPPADPHDDLPPPVEDLLEAYRGVSERRLVECYHDALQAREQVLQMFNLGYLKLEHRGLAERLYWATCARIRDLGRRTGHVPEELEDLESILSDTYFCNFSVFQSLPDSWAIGQLFPIMPIHRLDERPTRNAILADITCDSDGKIDRFVSLREVRRTLELHELRDGEEYYLGAFLVGAYQETLGDLHNLFGDTHVVHIRLHDQGGWWIEEVVKGDTAGRVLGYMQYEVDQLYPRFARDCERALREGRMTLAEAQALKRFYESELNGYTYLEPG